MLCKLLDSLCTFIQQASEDAYNNPRVQRLIREKPDFDVALLDPLYPDIGFHIAKNILDIPIVLFHTSNYLPITQRAMGNPLGLANIPYPRSMAPVDPEMSFLQRIQNALEYTICFLLQGTANFV